MLSAPQLVKNGKSTKFTVSAVGDHILKLILPICVTFSCGRSHIHVAMSIYSDNHLIGGSVDQLVGWLVSWWISGCVGQLVLLPSSAFIGCRF